MSLPSVCSYKRIRDTLRSITFVVTLTATAVQAGPIWCANIEVLYAPDDAPLDRVVTLYQQAKHYIYVSVYGLTYPRAVEAMVAAKKRGVDVRMIDRSGTHSRGETAQCVADIATGRHSDPCKPTRWAHASQASRNRR